MTSLSIVWFRQDLRLADQPALAAAAAAGPLIGLYVLDDDTPAEFAIGAAQRWWLHHSLAALAAALEARGGALILRRGPSAQTVAAVACETGADTVHAVRHYEPWWRKAEAALGGLLTLHDGDTLVPPEHVRTGAEQPFKVYSPFWRALTAHLPPPAPQPAPVRFGAPAILPKGDSLADWDLLPVRPDWATGFADEWTPGEAGAADRLADFLSEAEAYPQRRDRPSEEGTSRLSAHLHFGEVSPTQLWHALEMRQGAKFLKELAWRDFSRSAILGQPELGTSNGRPGMNALQWRTGTAADADFRAWTRGLTGYPIVDAGMRQMWTSGWMHNRVRMLAATLLVKHLLIDWRRGAAWFWDTLVDADYGNNSLNWQWIAGTGSDSAPFARIMAPLAQSDKFDAAGYIRDWVPELAYLSDDQIHDPHATGVAPPSYPAPLIGHREARARALAALAKARLG